MSDPSPWAVGALRFFSIAGFVGLIAGLWVALAPDGPRQVFGRVDGPVAARVNGIAITMLEYERAAQAVQNDRRNVLGPDEAARVLETLINEELLAQEAFRLGLHNADREVRAAAVRGMMRLILADLASTEPSERTLRAFYEGYPDLFVLPTRLWLRHLEIAGSREDDVAAIVTALREGAGFGDVLERFPEASSRPVPDRLIRAEDLSQYLGGTLSDYALATEEGAVIGPLEVAGNAHFLWLVERELDTRRPFENVRDAVSDEWRRRAEEDAVNTYLDRLRARSSIEIEVAGGQ